MHPANFIRGQWKWLPLFKYIDVPRAVTHSSFSEMKLTERRAIVSPSFRIASDYLLEANTKEWVSIDYEGTSYITCLGVGWNPSEACCVPLNRVGSSSYWNAEEEVILWKLWCALLQNPKVKKIAQNASYEWIKSWLHGIYPNPLGIDTMHAHHCLFPYGGGVSDEWTKRKRDIDNPGHGLALITSQYTDQPFYKDDGRHWRPEHGQEAFWRYNALDVMVTFEAGMKMRDELHKVGLWEVYEREYRECLETALRMEWYGIKIDVERRAAVRAETERDLKADLETLEQSIKRKVIAKNTTKGTKPSKDVLNLASPAQVLAFIKERGYAVTLNRKTGRPTVDKDAMNALAIKHDDESLRLILEVGRKQDFIDKVLSVKLDSENNIHCHWRLGGTNGTRRSSTESILESGTNLQNLNRTGPARSLFLPG